MCYACLGDRIDYQTGAPCPRCQGSGVDPDPYAYDFSPPTDFASLDSARAT